MGRESETFTAVKNPDTQSQKHASDEDDDGDPSDFKVVSVFHPPRVVKGFLSLSLIERIHHFIVWVNLGRERERERESLLERSEGRFGMIKDNFITTSSFVFFSFSCESNKMIICLDPAPWSSPPSWTTTSWRTWRWPRSRRSSTACTRWTTPGALWSLKRATSAPSSTSWKVTNYFLSF